MAQPMKDGIRRPAIRRLAGNLARHHPEFDSDAFVTDACRGLTKLELKARIAHVAEALHAHLPEDYPAALKILVASRKGWDRGVEDDPLRGFAAWPIFNYIERYGLEHFRISMSGLRKLTSLFSAEFAVRPYLVRYGDKAFAELLRWTKDKDAHVRRLASEGSRPLLPWATRVPGLVEDPSPALPILEALRDDPTVYVRRSVANHLNDIAKNHPELVIDLCTRWQKDASKERRWVIERATRTLVKAGHPGVWGLLGYTKQPKVDGSEIALASKSVAMGGDLDFEFELRSKAKREQKLVVDYAVHYMKANGQLKAKVFKLRNLELAPGASVQLSATISFGAISTRKYYPGEHAVEVLINGAGQGPSKFELRNQESGAPARTLATETRRRRLASISGS